MIALVVNLLGSYDLLHHNKQHNKRLSSFLFNSFLFNNSPTNTNIITFLHIPR